MKLSIVAMSRGFIVLDENVAYLEKPLTERNFRVFVVPKHTPDRQIAKSYLGGRKFITKNTKDFETFVPELDISLIDADHVTNDAEKLSDMISESWKKYKLGSIKGPWILRMNSNGKHVLEQVD
jgi:hypothetical protein